jgi:predicted NBD/HSP70 family sugar kinase
VSAPVLALDVGGTKMLAALVSGGQVLEARTIGTPRDNAPDRWCDSLAALAEPWTGRFAHAGLALTGGIVDGRWFALNPATLPVPAGFPVVDEMRRRLGVPVRACNDAQAAAWGEFRHGAGRGRDIVFLTVSTGIGGGIVSGGRLLSGRSGLAGHVGQIRLASADGSARLEDLVAGRAVAGAADGRAADAAGVADAAFVRGEAWALAIMDVSAALLARAVSDLQLLFDPDLVVIGGGLGLNADYRRRLVHAVESLPDVLRPTVVAAELGVNAGVVGVAALAGEANEG